MGKYFGTDGFRGEANCNLTADHAYQGRAFSRLVLRPQLKRRSGSDGSAHESSSARIPAGRAICSSTALVGGLVASGADAYLLHVTTTPQRGLRRPHGGL